MQFTRLALYGGSRGTYGDFSGKAPQDLSPPPVLTGVTYMLSINKNEYGDVLYANMKEDVSAATSLEMVIEPKIGTKLTKTDGDGVAVGVVNIVVGDETLYANEYLTYTTKDGDITRSGIWRTKGKAVMSATEKIIGDYEIFTVLD